MYRVDAVIVMLYSNGKISYFLISSIALKMKLLNILRLISKKVSDPYNEFFSKLMKYLKCKTIRQTVTETELV